MKIFDDLLKTCGGNWLAEAGDCAPAQGQRFHVAFFTASQGDYGGIAVAIAQGVKQRHAMYIRIQVNEDQAETLEAMGKLFHGLMRRPGNCQRLTGPARSFRNSPLDLGVPADQQYTRLRHGLISTR